MANAMETSPAGSQPRLASAERGRIWLPRDTPAINAAGCSASSRRARGTVAMDAGPTNRLRAICLALPETTEKETFGGPTYRVREKIFAMETGRDGRSSVWCKAPPGSQAVLVGADPDRFFVPPYVGPKGWIGMHLDAGPDWDEVVVVIRRSYRLIAPKRLGALV